MRNTLAKTPLPWNAVVLPSPMRDLNSLGLRGGDQSTTDTVSGTLQKSGLLGPYFSKFHLQSRLTAREHHVVCIMSQFVEVVL